MPAGGAVNALAAARRLGYGAQRDREDEVCRDPVEEADFYLHLKQAEERCRLKSLRHRALWRESRLTPPQKAPPCAAAL